MQSRKSENHRPDFVRKVSSTKNLVQHYQNYQRYRPASVLMSSDEEPLKLMQGKLAHLSLLGNTSKSLESLKTVRSKANIPSRPWDMHKRLIPSYQAHFSLPPTQQTKININISGGTHPGNLQRVNQDSLFCCQMLERNFVAFGIFDGHGREVGQLAAKTARDFFRSSFENMHDGIYLELVHNPELILRRLFEDCHTKIKQEFRAFYEKNGYIVRNVEPGDYLIKRTIRSNRFTGVHGGTTASIVLVFPNGKLYTANVGDSVGMLGGIKCPSISLRPIMAHGPQFASPYNKAPSSLYSHEKHTQLTPENNNSNNNNNSNDDDDDDDDGEGNKRESEKDTESKEGKGKDRQVMCDPFIITADHSPECPTEYTRVMRETSLRSPHASPLLFQYDNTLKEQRRPIYSSDDRGRPIVLNRGSYYKNVRNEWASLVSTPPTAQYGDALAFTRSLGDFHLHSYGVSFEPDIFEVDLTHLSNMHEGNNNNSSNNNNNNQGDEDETLVLVLASDGVWDNWKYVDLRNYLLESHRVNSSLDPKGVQDIASDLIDENIQRGHQYFEDSLDNMAVIVCYISFQPN